LLTELEKANLRAHCFKQALEASPKRFKIEDKPTTEELLAEAEKIAKFVIGE